MDESFIKKNLLLIVAFSIPTLFLIILCFLVILYPSKNPDGNLSILDFNEIQNYNQYSESYYEDEQNYNYENDTYQNYPIIESPVPLENYSGDAIFASCNKYGEYNENAYQQCYYYIQNIFVVKNNRLIPNFGEIDVAYEPAFYYYQVSTKKLEPMLYKDVISKKMVNYLGNSSFNAVYGEKITSYGNLVLGPDFYFIGYTEK